MYFFPRASTVMDLLLEMSNMCGAVCIFILGRLLCNVLVCMNLLLLLLELSNVLVCVYIPIGRPLLWVCYWIYV